MSRLDAMFGTLVGREIPGGCDTCDAYQTVRPDPVLPGMWHCTVHHDDWCPTLRAMQAPRGAP